MIAPGQVTQRRSRWRAINVCEEVAHRRRFYAVLRRRSIVALISALKLTFRESARGG